MYSPNQYRIGLHPNYPLNVIRLRKRPLPERRDEIPKLARHFLTLSASEFKKRTAWQKISAAIETAIAISSNDARGTTTNTYAACARRGLKASFR